MTERENRALYIAEECRKAGMTLAGAAGVLANVEAESAFSPTNVQDTYESHVGNDATYTERVDNGSYHNFTKDAAGYGLVQWTESSRKAMMLAYFKQRGVSIGDFKTQVSFLIDEMRNYKKAWNTVTQSNDPYECGYNICFYYEIPDNKAAQSANRGGNARAKWYPWLVAAMNSGAASKVPDSAQRPTPQKPSTAAESTNTGGVLQRWRPRTIDSVHCSGWPEIKLLQSLLLCHGYNTLVDGIWSQELTQKFTAFQIAAGLEPDNMCGPASYTALGIRQDIFR